MAYDIAHDTGTPADEARKLLDTAERLLPLIREQKTAAAEILACFDQIETRLSALEEEGVDVRAELGRWEALQRALQARAHWLVPAMASWPAARQQAQAQPERWWWYLDETVAASRRGIWLRRFAKAAAVVAIAVLAVLLLRHFFPTDPQVAAANDRILQAQLHTSKGEWADAFTFYEQATHFTPNDPLLYIWLGVLSEQMEQAEAAPAWYDKARAIINDPTHFYIERAAIYLQINQTSAGERDARAALALNDQSSHAYFVLGGALEMEKRTDEALKAYDQAANLAEKDDPNLTALARVRMGFLLQAQQIQAMEGPTATP